MSGTVSCMSTLKQRRDRKHAIVKVERAHSSTQGRTHPHPSKPPISIRARGPRLLRPDMHVRYPDGVAARSIDREAWANVVAQLIRDEAGGNTTRFAELVGVTYKTVRRWLTQQTEVSEESIRQVGRALGVKPGVLLARVGLYEAAELATISEPEPVADDDPALRVILEADVPPRIKQRMIQRLQQMRARDAERQVDEVRWWIDQARGA